MSDERLHLDGVCVEEARHLRLIANDLRLAGDCRLVLLSEEGVSNAGTLADELWLIALRLDPDHAFDNPYSPDGPPLPIEGPDDE
jgi:hypothetical protein